MYENQQYGLGQPGIAPQSLFGGMFGAPLGGLIGRGIGTVFGNPNLGGRIGEVAGGIGGGLLPFGADPTGATDNTARLQQAVDAGRAQGRTVWIPPGTYTVYDHVIVDQVTVRGAGPWHTVLSGRHPTDRWKAVPSGASGIAAKSAASPPAK